MQILVFELMNKIWFLKPLNFSPGKKDCSQLSFCWFVCHVVKNQVLKRVKAI